MTVIDRKYFVTVLLECNSCGLAHRHPKDKASWLQKFYQSNYGIDTAMMTYLPSMEELGVLKVNNFSDLRDYASYINALMPKSPRILDYGCSWGYNVFKLIRSGFNTVGYELSVSRAEFGKQNLGVSIYTNLEDVPGGFDIILSSHVVEHLFSIPDYLHFCRERLTENGLFIAFMPNGSAAYREREPETFHVNWGSIHPNYLNVEFATYMFRQNPYLILTGDWEFDLGQIRSWNQRDQVLGLDHSGKELLIIALPNTKT